MWAVGRNNVGELGLGTPAGGSVHVGVTSADEHSATPIINLGADNIQVAAGGTFSAVLKASGEVFTFGTNSAGQLGIGSSVCGLGTPNCRDLSEDRNQPVQVTALGENTVQLALSEWHAFALKQDGTAYSWGMNQWGQLGIGECTAGYNDSDPACSGTDKTSPVEITGLGSDNVYIAASGQGGMALKSNGRLFNWGENGYNQLGDGTTTDRHLPAQLFSVGTNTAHVVGGYDHTLLLQSDGTVMAWGRNTAGQIGNGERGSTPQATPIVVSALAGRPDLPWRSVQIAVGLQSSYAMLSDGSIYGWGRNGQQQLGDGTTEPRLRPVRIEGFGADVAFKLPDGGVRSLNMFVLQPDGGAMGSGANERGQMGTGDTGSVATATALPGLGERIVQIARGESHTLVLKEPPPPQVRIRISTVP